MFQVLHRQGHTWNHKRVHRICYLLKLNFRRRGRQHLPVRNPAQLAIEIDLNIPAQHVVRVLDRIVANRGYPRKMRMDNGPVLVSLALAQWAEKHGVMLEFIKPGKQKPNAFIKRFIRTYLTEILVFFLFRPLNEAREITERWLAEYHSQRPHESLNSLTPEEYQLMAEKPETSKSAERK